MRPDKRLPSEGGDAADGVTEVSRDSLVVRGIMVYCQRRRGDGIG
jgi:hypothetical protein